MKKIILASFTVAIVAFACKKETAEEPKETPTPTVTVKFAADVLPIFTANCGTGGTCHGTGMAANGKVYETHAGASAVPSSTTKGAINHSSGFHNMPKNGSKLSAEKIGKIESWIDGGMKND